MRLSRKEKVSFGVVLKPALHVIVDEAYVTQMEESWFHPFIFIIAFSMNRPFSYSAKEPGSSVIFIHFYTRDSIEWR